MESRTSKIAYPSNGGTAHGYLALPPSGSGPGVVVIQEWWGLTSHIVDVAHRLAAAGFVALAPDLYGGTTTHDVAEADRLMRALPVERAAADLGGAVDHLLGLDAVTGDAVGAVGFCMGGGFVLTLAAQQGPRVGAVVTFYGVLDGRPDFTGLTAPVLGHFGRLDTTPSPAGARRLADRLAAASGRRPDVRFYPADHAFFNDENPMGAYDADAARQAWAATLTFLRAHLRTAPPRELRTAPGDRTLATASRVVARRPRLPFDWAEADDFTLAEPLPLRRVPADKLLPYAFDLDARELVLTFHADVGAAAREPFLYVEQRTNARYVVRVPFEHLDRAFGPPDPAAAPILIFSIGRTGSTLLNALLGCATSRAYSEPDAVTQLALRRPEFAALGTATHRNLAWHALSALLPSGGGCAVKFRSQAARAMPDVLDAFPSARFIYLLRERRAWGRSVHRAFPGTDSDEAARELLDGVRSLALMRSADVESHVVHYEDLVAAPEHVVAQLLGTPDLSPETTARITAVMARDAQAGSEIGRTSAAPEPRGERRWLADFDAAWAKIRPAHLIDRHCPRLEAGGAA
ncbi:dienelactone hydrolase family protein [Actinomadura rubteroloni]|uniref:dienelactone hydrolase family protein n=1 Tax=Actinomadura rubteroloni TaxID=1926885 RepID=UPI00196B4BD4|nr:dienelactone hydrolase family protein [Actinomadura rubteroloni]